MTVPNFHFVLLVLAASVSTVFAFYFYNKRFILFSVNEVVISKYFLDKLLVTVVEIKLVRVGGDIKIFGAAT